MDNHDLEIFGKGYLSSTEVLPENSKLFLYTDGLTETRPINGDNIFFSDSQLNETLIRLSNNGCHEFAENVFEQLVLFRGSRLFEDDIALICLDIPKK
jgi:serine phosphatase RsbU (regulator of sigma subunit)